MHTNNVDKKKFFSLFLTIIQYFFHIYMLATFVQKPYHINDTARISCCFSIVTIHVLVRTLLTF